MSGTSVFVRVTLTAVVVVVFSIMVVPFMLFRLMEGAYLAASFFKDWNAQIWGRSEDRKPSPPRVG